MGADADRERRLEHQRQRNRMKQRRHKARYIGERQDLEDQIHELSSVIENHSVVRALSWHDIAIALRDARSTATATLEKLKARHARMQKTYAGAMAMAISLSRRDNLPAPAHQFAYLDATLADDPTARRLGLDWFSQHMYHNTESMVEYAEFAPSGGQADTVMRECGAHHLDMLSRIQIHYDSAFDETYAALKDRLWSIGRGETLPYYSEFLDDEITAAIDPNMHYRRMFIDTNQSNYNVCREFNTDGRVVFVLGNFAHDARHLKNVRFIPSMCWLVLERVSPSATRLRIVMYNGPLAISDRFVPWDEEFDSLPNPRYERTVEGFQRCLREDILPNIQEKVRALSLK
ncbi:hypothetical protein ACHHYP_09575 [Achlya hypogyna]|uniref:BZIP domain-containing protein n=1 Tax=Achlya hypogyna TaxID=1202772 RepID=A0A1V9YN54_ACHHY|nr:hypothetical protein ACHHYP_09575 [Achlya hypogyna]